MIPVGRTFYKMSGSGNDFVVVDATVEPASDLLRDGVVAAICSPHTGIGADGLVLLEPSSVANFRMVYLNSDGSRADLCGNASLCCTRLAAELGIVKKDDSELRMETDAGILRIRIGDGLPEVDLQPVHEVRPATSIPLQPGECWATFVLAGVPHLVIRVEDVSTVDVVGRGRPLRHHEAFPSGANVNFVAPGADGSWRIRTYERGVEGETLACGTGSIATAIALRAAGDVGEVVTLVTRSGRNLRIRLIRDGGSWLPSLSGEARIVYQGQFCELQ